MSKISHILRYPVKGLPAQSCKDGILEPDRGLVGDRLYAISKSADKPYNSWAKKSYFLQWMTHPKLARLRCVFQVDTGQADTGQADTGYLQLTDEDRLLFEGRLDAPEEAEALADILQSFLDLEEKPLLHKAQKGSFTDQSETVISLGQTSSLAAVNGDIGEPEDLFMARFRLNIWLEGGSAFEELDWVGRRARLGSAELYFTEPVGRCQAINASPATGRKRQDEALSDLTQLLRSTYDHDCLGVFARIEKAGHFSTHDQLIFI